MKPTITYKHAFEIPSDMKKAFLAGAAMGIDAYRRGAPLRTMAAIEQIGNLCMGDLLTRDILPEDPTLTAVEFFNHFWDSITKAE